MKREDNWEKNEQSEAAVSYKTAAERNTSAGPGEIGKQLGIFLGICLPLTWILMGLGYTGVTEEGMTPGANILITLGCFMPAIAAILTSLITKESLWKLQFMPRLKGNGKIYLMATLLGIFISTADVLLLVLLFADKARFHEEATAAMVIFTFLLMLSTSFLQFWVGMGEELGWMGYLFPRLEKLCGTTVALIATGIIRSLWHWVMLIQDENFLTSLLSLCVSNILLGSVLVWATKASKSVIPASLIHVMTNALPGALTAYMVLDESVYSATFSSIDLIMMLPGAVVGVICYIVLMKNYSVKDNCCNRDK